LPSTLVAAEVGAAQSGKGGHRWPPSPHHRAGGSALGGAGRMGNEKNSRSRLVGDPPP